MFSETAATLSTTTWCKNPRTELTSTVNHCEQLTSVTVQSYENDLLLGIGDFKSSDTLWPAAELYLGGNSINRFRVKFDSENRCLHMLSW
jgi:hypothetical protein